MDPGGHMRAIAFLLCFGCGGGDTEPPPPDDLCALSSRADGEGGGVIVEYVHYDTELQAALLPPGVTSAARVIAYFMNAHVPDANPLPVPGECNNLEADEMWPLFVADERTDLDVGTLTIRGRNESDASVDLTIPKLVSTSDALGRPHDVFYQTVVSDAGGLLVADSRYDVTFSGAGSIPPTAMDDAIILPNEFTVNSPDLEGDGPLIAGTDFSVGWTAATTTGMPSSDPTVIGGDVLGLAWLVDVTGRPTHLCVTLHNEGELTISGSTISEYRAIATARGASPDAVILQRSALVHRVERLPNGEACNVRRLDMLGTTSWAQRMQVQPPL
jgi:hypothetical protein